MSVFTSSLKELYIGYFGRAPDPEGLAFWENALAEGFTIVATAQDFAGQPETLAGYPYLADPSSSDLTTFLGTVYDNLFARVPDAPGLAFWVDAIEAGLPLGTAILDIIEGAIGPDIDTLANKVELACRWTDMAEIDPDFVLTPEAINSSYTALKLVTADPETIAPDGPADDILTDFFNERPMLDVNAVLGALAEDADTSERIKVADIAIVDDDLGVNTLSLSPDSADVFELDGMELFLKAGVVLDHDVASVLFATILLDDGQGSAGPDDRETFYLDISDVSEPGPDPEPPVPTPNSAPTVTLRNTVAILAEDADTAVRTKVADIVLRDDGLGINTLSLIGADAALFEIDGSDLFLRAGATLDFERNPSLDVRVAVDDASVGATPDATAPLRIAITDVNETPNIGLTNVVTEFAENADTTVRTKVADIVVSDDGLGTNAVSLSGADMALFEIDGAELFLVAGAVLDFETNATLDVTVEVEDASVGTAPDDTATLAIAVTDAVDEIELIDIEDDTNANGFVINGVSNGDQSGRSVSNAGDVNGDGFDDLIVGAPEDDPNGSGSGAAFVVFGKENGAAVELSDIQAGLGGFVINGVSSNDDTGWRVSNAGDVNGDGLSDLIVGAQNADEPGTSSLDREGVAYVVFGKADGAIVELSDVETGTGGFAVSGGGANGSLGRSVSSAGDLNGDGLDDLIIGAPYQRPNGQASGRSYVVFGKTDGALVSDTDIRAGLGGFAIDGTTLNDRTGKSVSGAGDINGDGIDDLVVAAPAGGQAYVIFGKADGTTVDPTDIEAGIGGFVINVEANSVSVAGDVNGDGLADLIVGAPGLDPNGPFSGASFVVFGKADGVAVDAADIQAGFGGFAINGVSENDSSGYSVSGAGDVNGDGFDDLIVGAFLDDPNGNNSGAGFVVFGKGDTTAVELSEIEMGRGGFVLNGVSTGDGAGLSVSSAGDVNGDGFADLIVGARYDDPNGGNSGASFVVFGGGFSGAATEIGTTADDILTGSTDVERLIGGTGNDTLIGSGGEDVLRGGAGDDVLAVSDLNFADIDGGNGVDTLRLDGTGLRLDLLALDNTSLDGVERIDLGMGGNTLRLDKIELQRLSDTSNTLRVLGDASDQVSLVGFGWSAEAAVTDAEGTFDVFIDGEARLEIAQGVARTGGPIVPVELSALELSTNNSGFVINGALEMDRIGRSVSDAGDVNGDGFDDLIVGSSFASPNGNSSGASFVVFGKPDGTAVDLSDVKTGTGGFAINGIAEVDFAGQSVSTAGDVNNDGFDDLIVGAPLDDTSGSNAGASYVVFGKSDGITVELSDIQAGFGGFAINGVSAGDSAGDAVSNAGDVNGDGFDDLIVGAFVDEPNGERSGASFVVFGKEDGTAVELSAVEAGTGGFVINGTSAFDDSGSSVSTAGDVNGDGFDDLIVGAPGGDPNGNQSGASFVVFGKTDGGVVDLSDIGAGTGGFVINGASDGDDTDLVGDNSGYSVSAAGDVNGDGFDDLIVGAPFADPNGDQSGASFVVFGKADGSAVELSAVLGGTGGFVINGVGARDRSGFSVSSAGDVNGDGFDDVIIGANRDDPNGNDSGASFVVFGKEDGSPVALSDVENGTGGFVINGGGADDWSGNSVSGAGDVNGDGFDDLIVGAPYDDPNGDISGASFVVFGGDFTGAATQIGTSGNNTLIGTNGNDLIFAGTGDDRITASQGMDRISGGEGADVFEIPRFFNGPFGTHETIITDFVSSEGDKIDFTVSNFLSFSQLQSDMSADGPGGHDTRIDLTQIHSVVLIGVQVDDLNASDFLLPSVI